MSTQKIKFGDILVLSKGVIVHGCNAQGVMGSGIAGQIKTKYPNCYRVYKDICDFAETKDSLMGLVIPYAENDLIILNAITQLNFGKDGKQYVSYKAIQDAFKTVAESMVAAGIEEVNYPLIGAGLGGGNWSIISNIIEEQFADYPFITRNLWIYE